MALAQLLGMHLNPLDWTIPTWEQALRVRLWWTLVMHDAWMSFRESRPSSKLMEVNSRPAVIQPDNNSVPLPSFSSVITASCAFSSASTDSAKSFISSCRLAVLVQRLQSKVCTLGAVKRMTSLERRDEVLSIAASADLLYVEWLGHTGGGNGRPTGVCEYHGPMVSQ